MNQTQPEPDFVVHNQTRNRLRLTAGDDVIEIGPLEKRTLANEDVASMDLRKHRAEGVIDYWQESAWQGVDSVGGRRSLWRQLLDQSAGLLTIAAALFFIGAPALGFGGTAVSVAQAVAAASIVVLSLASPEQSRRALIRTVVPLVAFAIPLYFIMYTTDFRSLLREAAINRGVAEPGLILGFTSSQFGYVVVRYFQIASLGIVSVLPGLLVFIFERRRSRTLRDRFTLNIFRFDPEVKTLGNMNTKYGLQMAEAFGHAIEDPADSEDEDRLVDSGPGSMLQVRWGGLVAVMLATGLIAGGWAWTFANPSITQTQAEEAGIASLLIDLFTPSETVMSYAFLGAYFFALLSVLRGYLRLDLAPKTYGRIAVRIVEAFIIAWILQLIAGDQLGVEAANSATGWDASVRNGWLVTAFLAGVLPETFWKWVQEKQRTFLPNRSRARNRMYQQQPLTDLQGIDIYDRARLGDEGVNNVQALAHGDPVALMLHTRIPAERIIDWLDQAILVVRATAIDLERGHDTSAISNPNKTDPSAAPIQGESRETDTTPQPLITVLRSHGIRSATDLIAVIDAGKVPRSLASHPTLESVAATVRQAEWMAQVNYWKEQSSPGRHTEVISCARAG